MWHNIHVARALFTWEKWRASLVHQWMSEPSLRKLSSLSDLRLVARTALQELGLKGPAMTLYWICSVDSVCNLDDEDNFLRIVIPSWLLKRKFNPRQTKLTPGELVSPPSVMTEMDLLKRYPESNRESYPKRNSSEILLSENHPLCSILRVRGRHKKHSRKRTIGRQTLRGLYDEIIKEEDGPKKQSATDRPTEYSDRLAVICAALRRKGLPSVKIAKRFGLPITKPFSSKQSDKARYLVERGEKLIEKYSPDKKPKKRAKPGRLPHYPDCLAVKCAVLKQSGTTDVRIAKQLGLPVDVVRHLVNRGTKLISECRCVQPAQRFAERAGEKLVEKLFGDSPLGSASRILREPRKAPTRCPHCGARSPYYDDEDKVYKCILCGRIIAAPNN